MEFEIGDKVKVIGSSTVGEVIDIDYGENIVTISDSYAETNNSELEYKADEVQLLTMDHDEDNEHAEDDGDVVIDPYAEEKPAEEKASDDFFPDARDQHLIRQDLTKATGGK